MKTILLGSVALVAIGLSLATARTFEAWGHEFETSDFTPQTVDVGVLTDKATKHHMNIIRLKNRHMMAVVPMDQFMALYKMTDADDMISSGGPVGSPNSP